MWFIIAGVLALALSSCRPLPIGLPIDPCKSQICVPPRPPLDCETPLQCSRR